MHLFMSVILLLIYNQYTPRRCHLGKEEMLNGTNKMYTNFKYEILSDDCRFDVQCTLKFVERRLFILETGQAGRQAQWV